MFTVISLKPDFAIVLPSKYKVKLAAPEALPGSNKTL